MFSHDGPARSLQANVILAGYLAMVAGFVNSGGFILIGSFTSHVTGSVGRLSNDVAQGNSAAALFAALLVVTFFIGSFAASVLVENLSADQLPRAYGIALLIEGTLLALFIFVAGLSHATHPRALDGEAAMLCMAMGMQNSLVTRLSGAVVRTTHLTGVVTDLGIEAARWYRWHRQKLSLLGFTLHHEASQKPKLSRSLLLGTIVAAFMVGAVLGALLTLHASRWSMVVPATAVWLASAFALTRSPRVAIDANANDAND